MRRSRSKPWSIGSKRVRHDQSSFCFLPGVGVQTQRRFWREGLVTWEDFLTTHSLRHVSGIRKARFDEEITRARDHFVRLDIRYFARTVPARYQWRLYQWLRPGAVYLDPSYYQPDGQAYLLDKVKTALLKTYKTPKISRNGQAVTITFSNFIVDVVPSFNREGGGFLIPNSTMKRWISADPRVHVDLMTKQNDVHKEVLVPIAKMIKGWNKVINHSFRTFYLELLAIKVFTNIRITDFPSGMRYFFDKGRESIKFKAIDPAGYGDQINPLESVSTVEEAVSRFDTAYSRARKAEEYASKGWVPDAIAEWKKMFGDYFPTYG